LSAKKVQFAPSAAVPRAASTTVSVASYQSATTAAASRQQAAAAAPEEEGFIQLPGYVRWFLFAVVFILIMIIFALLYSMR
jgi:hypothetical protein